jgi:hypothetical protein
VHLRGLTELNFLYLQDTQVTEKGRQELRKLLPNLNLPRQLTPFIEGEVF